jgi:hypothetical protein
VSGGVGAVGVGWVLELLASVSHRRRAVLSLSTSGGVGAVAVRWCWSRLLPSGGAGAVDVGWCWSRRRRFGVGAVAVGRCWGFRRRSVLELSSLVGAGANTRAAFSSPVKLITTSVLVADNTSCYYSTCKCYTIDCDNPELHDTIEQATGKTLFSK